MRVKITETATGSVRLETRLPSQFVDGMATVIPQVGKGNATQMLDCYMVMLVSVAF